MKKKHPVKKRSQGLLPSILILTLLCSGCGVGGNEESSENVELPKNGATLFSEGAIKYTGTTAPARITRANAKEIMLSGYYGLDSVTPVLNKADQKKPLLSPDKNRKGAGTTPFFLRKILPSDSLLKFSPFENESANIQGECGGNLTLEIDSREPAGNFSGKITFVDYCMFDTTVSGEARIEAALSEDGTTLKRFKYELGLITAYWEDKSTLFTGTVVWKSRSDQSPFYRWKFNITLRDDTSKNTFRFEDYTITVKVNEFFVENNLEGKFYHPEHGLVTVRTHSPLRLYFNAIYPFKGGLSYEGQDNTRGELFFMSPTEIKLRADTDGNGLIDWEETGQRNTPPEADAGPTQTVFQGDIITLDGTASFDPESAPLEFNWTFESCPQECPELQNHTSRVATFIPDHRGTYRVLLVVTDGEDQSSDAVAIIVKGLESSSLLSLEWAHGILGTRIGLSGLSLVDINGDQTKEIISAGGDEFGGNVFWYILSPEANGTFSQVWRSARYPAVIKKIEAVDVNRDGEVEILVGLENGVIHFYKGKTRKNIGRIQISDHLTDFTIADTNGDEKVELVATDGTGIFVYNPENLSLLRSATSYGGDKIRVGNVDADPWLEIVTTARGHKHDQRPTGYVLSASTFRVEWKYINGFGRLLELGDIDNDGRDEIIGASGGNRVTIFEGETQSADWEIHADLDIDALHISDVNGDGVPEILFDDWRRIFCIDGVSHLENWSFLIRSSETTDIVTGDVDGDGVTEIIWGSSSLGRGPDYLNIIDTETFELEWTSVHLDQPLSATDVGDIDGDGEDEIIMISFKSKSGFDDGIIHVFDAKTHKLEFRSNGLPDILAWSRVYSVKIGDVDGDGDTEFVVATANSFYGRLFVFNGKTHLLERKSPLYSGASFTALALGDVDGDGDTEIVAGQTRRDDDDHDKKVSLLVFDGATALEEWRSPDLKKSEGIYDIEIADNDGDGHNEILTSAKKKIYVFDGVTRQVDWVSQISAYALEVFDLDEDGVEEILIGTKEGSVDVYNGSNYSFQASHKIFDEAPVNSLLMDDLTADGTTDCIITGNGELQILDLANQTVKYRVDGLGDKLGWRNHLLSQDIDGDGKKEVVLGSATQLYQFETK